MANLIGIVGEQGTGKSSSIESLDPTKTYVINVQNKPLPFKGSASKYSKENKNTASLDQWNKVVDALNGVASNRPEIENIIIDDAGFIMSTEFMKRASEKGYDKYSELGQHMFNIIDTAKNLRSDLNVIFTFHSNDSTDAVGNKDKRIKTVGKLLEDKYTPELRAYK